MARDPAGSDRARLEIDKSERQLRLYVGDRLEETYPVGLGFAPIGAKERQGDGATPEGRYSICVKNPYSRYYLSVGLDYPNDADADRALGAGIISRDQHTRISRALEGGACPPWNTDLGGEIFIHGRGSSADWTLGCVALDDPAMKRLFEAVEIGTPVTIKP